MKGELESLGYRLRKLTAGEAIEFGADFQLTKPDGNYLFGRCEAALWRAARQHFYETYLKEYSNAYG